MNAAAPFTPSTDAPEAVRAFGAILAGLMAVIARLVLRRPDLLRLALPLWRWLNAAVRRLERAATGPVRGRVTAKRVACAPVVPGVRLPSGRAWLVREFGWEVAAFGSQLQHLLSQDAMQALLRERPAVGRILRPICRVLGVEVVGLKPVKPVVVKPPVVRAPRVRAKREAPWRPGPIRPWWGPPGAKSG